MSVFGSQIDERAVRVFPAGVSKHDALEAMVEAIVGTGAVRDTEAFRRAVYDRESIMSTGIGQGVAIPHVRIPEVTAPTIGVGVSREGIDFDTLDNEPVHIIVLFAMPSGSQKEYLGLLAKVMLALKTPGFHENMMACDDAQALLHVLNS